MNPPGDQDNDDTKEEDADLWDYVTRDVAPLPGRDKPPAENKKTSRAQKQRKSSSPQTPPAQKNIKKSAKSREIDRRTAQRLRRGQMEIEARLDLHGMNRVAAQQALQNFLARCYQQGRRHVLIITGKSARNKEEPLKPGILRQAVPEWLIQPPLQEIVLQFAQARPQHGGEGAFYVLLRRKR